jgi:hypothetical protein
MRASMVRISIPTSETRTKASMTRPLSRMISITSARPLGRGRSMYPCGVVATAMVFPLRSRCPGDQVSLVCLSGCGA